MPEQIVFTCLPRKINLRAGTLALSVHVGPRLRHSDVGGTSLRDIDGTSFLDWPATLRTIAWKVELGNLVLDATLDTSRLSSAYWADLFPADLPVVDHQPPLDVIAKIKSFPVQHVANPVLDRYVAVARVNPTENPALAQVESYLPMSFRSLKTGESVLRYHYERMENRRIQGTTTRSIEPKVAVLQQNLLQTQTFLDPNFEAAITGQTANRSADGSASTGASDPPAPPDSEFHALVAYLQDRTALLRPLGLVFDLVVALPSGFTPPGETTVRARPQWSRASESPPPPRTQSILTSSRFMAKPRGTAIADGLVALENPAYAFHDWDVESGTVKTLSFAAAVGEARFGGGTTSQPKGDPDLRPPGFRSTGLSLSQLGRATELDAHLARIASMQTSLDDGSLLLHAEDITRGYRIDVIDLDGDKVWRSLMRRNGKHVIRRSRTEVPVVDEEGVVTLALTKNDDAPTTDVYVSEILTRWDGWSLAVERPHAHVGTDGAPEKVDRLAWDENGRLHDPNHVSRYPLTDEYQVPAGSLPRLRFGHRYRFRARTVDLAGDSAIPYTAASSLHASPAVTYRRHDPVSAPHLLFRAPPTEGENANTLVIRSDYNTDPASTAACVRIVAPPKVAQHLVEQCGVLDSAEGGRLDPSRYAEIVERDRATFLDSRYRQPPVPAGADPTVGQETMWFTRSDLIVPYYPDPDIVGATFRNLPGGAIGPVPFYASGDAFPGARTFELRLVEGSGPPQVEPPTRTSRFYRVTVYLPKGATKKVSIAAALAAAGLGRMALFDQMAKAGAPSEEITALKAQAEAGLLWATSPQQTIRMIHAVRRPILAPIFSAQKQLQRTVNRTAAHLVDPEFVLHRGSTASLSLSCTWTERVDDGPGTAPPTTRTAEFVITPALTNEPVTTQDPTQRVAIRHTLDLGDTRHRALRILPTAHSRFSEYFRERFVVALPADETPVALKANIVKGSVIVQLPGAAETFVEGRHYVVDHAAGSIRRPTTAEANDTDRNAVPAGQPVEVSLLSGEFWRSPARPTPLNMPSSARPAPPKFAYAVPAFQWDSYQSGDVFTSVRSGNRLRIFLERPWWSSGDGEKLGIVFWVRPPGSLDPRPASLEKLVSVRATDPVYGSPVGTPDLNAASFPGATIVPGRLAEAPAADAAVYVATYPVTYDPDKDLYYADVELATERYSPLLRLALVRYQPNSLGDTHISRVRLTDFLTVAPTRVVELQRADGATTFNLTVTGQGTNAIKGVATPAQVRASLQTKDSEIPDPDLGWSTLTRTVGRIPVAHTYTLTPSVQSNGTIIWRGTDLPIPAGTRRVLVEELERMRDDHDPESSAGHTSSRVVFTDHLPLEGPR